MYSLGQTKIGHRLLQIYFVAIVVCFITAEGLGALAITHQQTLRFDSHTQVLYLYLFPLFATSPLLGGYLTYRHIKSYLQAIGVDPANLRPVWYEVITLIVLSYALLISSFAMLLPAYHSLNR